MVFREKGVAASSFVDTHVGPGRIAVVARLPYSLYSKKPAAFPVLEVRKLKEMRKSADNELKMRHVMVRPEKIYAPGTVGSVSRPLGY